MKIAIQGHPTRGREVIQILESLYGINKWKQNGKCSDCAYYIDSVDNIYCFEINGYHGDKKIYTLEKFEKEFPFKVGDKVKDCSDNEVGIILRFTDIDNELMYVVDFEKSGHANMPAEELKPYREMKEERNIALTLDKAKEWYKKGGELKEIALQAFTEQELNPLPRSWDEFSYKCRICSTRYAMPSKYTALYQLEQLRDCWRQGWEPSERNTGYCIAHYHDGYSITSLYCISFLSFPTREMAEEFLKCFRDLIEQAGDLI